MNMDVLLGSEYLCSLIFTYNDPHTIFCVCQRVCKKWRKLLLSHTSDCCIWKSVYKSSVTSPQSPTDTQALWVELNKSIYRSNIATYQNVDEKNILKSPPLHSSNNIINNNNNNSNGNGNNSKDIISGTYNTSNKRRSTDHQGTLLYIVRRTKSIEKKKLRKPPNISWRSMVQMNCVPIPRRLHFLYLKGKATEMHSGSEFQGNFDILMLGWNHYFIRIQGEKYWRFTLVVNEFYCRFLRIFVGRTLRTRSRRLCFEEREDKGGSMQVSEVGRVLFSSTSQRLLGLTGTRDDKLKLNRDCIDNVTFNNEWRSMTFEQAYYYPTLHCVIPHVISLSDKQIGKYTVEKVCLLDKYVSEEEAMAWFEGIKEKSNTERSSYWEEIKQLP